MAYREVDMWEILEVLRRLHRGEPNAAIERATGNFDRIVFWLASVLALQMSIALPCFGLRVELVLDGSGSMWVPVGEETKIEVAKKVLADLIGNTGAHQVRVRTVPLGASRLLPWGRAAVLDRRQAVSLAISLG